MSKALPLRPGAVTSVGSLPHHDADEAAEFVLSHHPGMPAAPQLPLRSPLEGMIAQAARGIHGVELAADGTLSVDAARLDAEAPVDPSLDGAGHAGLLAFLSLVAGRTDPVKIQLTGPITLGLALVEAGADPKVAFPVALAAVRARGSALTTLCRQRLPQAPLVAFLDEPGLTAVAGGLPLDIDAATDLLSSALAALELDATTGVHCCGPTDWRMVSAAGPTVLSLPATAEAALADPAPIGQHLERGGWIAWGAVPTHEPLGTDADRLWRRLSAIWCELVKSGCDPVQLRAQALITPACGLAGHGISQASRSLHLASDLAKRVSDQAVAARLSMGA